jgi:hypothetical protein
MRDYLRKTWVKAGLVFMALPTALANASPSSDEGQAIANAGLTASLNASANPPTAGPLEGAPPVSVGLAALLSFTGSL